MSFPTHTGQAEWDARQEYMRTLSTCMTLALQARLAKDSYSWFSILDGIVSQYGSAIRNKKLLGEIRDKLELLNNTLHPVDDDSLTAQERSSAALDILRKLEPVLSDALFSSGLLLPLVRNPRGAAAEGLA